MEKQDSRRLSAEERQVLRTTVVRLYRQGKKKTVISELLGIRYSTIINWINRYQSDGSKGLRENKRGVTSESKKLLTDAQEISVQKMITDTMPDQLRLDFALWTRKAVKELVEREFGIVLAINTVGDYLRK